MANLGSRTLSSEFGLREDGTPKGKGFFGVLKRPDGKVSSELSFDFNAGGKKVFAPLLVPTLSKDEIRHLLNGNKPTKQIFDKAAGFAMERLRQGKPTFATKEEEGKFKQR